MSQSAELWVTMCAWPVSIMNQKDLEGCATTCNTRLGKSRGCLRAYASAWLPLMQFEQCQDKFPLCTGCCAGSAEALHALSYIEIAEE